MIAATKETKIKDWYHKQFPLDEEYITLRPSITFESLFRSIRVYDNIYKVLFFDKQEDPLIRERIFRKLSEVMKVDYDYISLQWIKSMRIN